MCAHVSLHDVITVQAAPHYSEPPLSCALILMISTSRAIGDCSITLFGLSRADVDRLCAAINPPAGLDDAPQAAYTPPADDYDPRN